LLPSCRDRRERASAGQTFRKQAGLVGGAPLPTPVNGSLREPTNHAALGNCVSPRRRALPASGTPGVPGLYENAQPLKDAGDVHNRQVVLRRLLVSCGYGSKPFDAVQKALDVMTLDVELAIEVVVVSFATRTAADDRLHPTLQNCHDDAVCVVTLVGKHGMSTGMLKEYFSHRRVVLLAWRYRHVEREALRVGDDMKIGGESAARAAEGIGLDPPFAPDESW